MKRPPESIFHLMALLFFVFATRAFAQESVLSWLNGLRAAVRAPAVQEDELLSLTALDWARTLAHAGIVSHRSADGSDALDRYRANGGSDARVGEIIGAGPTLSVIERAWGESPSHRALALRSYWTHAGVGEYPSGLSSTVCVVMFCVRLVDGLRVTRENSQVLFSGRFKSPEASGALLIAGIDVARPENWDRTSRTFLFRLPSADLASYIRLGFVTAEGGFFLTNAFTLPRGTGSPGGSAHFAAPGAQR
jgi:hypothetical protein